MNNKEDNQSESGPEQVYHTKKRSTLSQSHETRSKERGHGKIRVAERKELKISSQMLKAILANCIPRS